MEDVRSFRNYVADELMKLVDFEGVELGDYYVVAHYDCTDKNGDNYYTYDIYKVDVDEIVLKGAYFYQAYKFIIDEEEK